MSAATSIASCSPVITELRFLRLADRHQPLMKGGVPAQTHIHVRFKMQNFQERKFMYDFIKKRNRNFGILSAHWHILFISHNANERLSHYHKIEVLTKFLFFVPTGALGMRMSVHAMSSLSRALFLQLSYQRILDQSRACST